MSAKPSVLRATVLIWQNDRLEAVISEGMGQVVYGGYVIIGHEVRSYQPCHQEMVLWLLGTPDVMSTLRRAYARTAPDAKPYQPVIMYLEGKWVGRRETGFGADYPTASCTAGSPGRVRCSSLEYLCTGSTHQPEFLQTIESLASLPYVQRIDAMDFE